MPFSNHFRHQNYCAAPPSAPCQLLALPPFAPVGSDEFTARMRRVGQAYRDAGVGAIVLVHGTFVGSDALGILAELSRVLPAAAAALQRTSKRLVNRVAGDGGNFADDYARLFETAINAPGLSHIPVRLLPWSGQNNHIGRADAAVQLIERIAGTPLADGRRVLLWGHSHAGNVFALVTNLLAADQETRDRFFDAARIYYRWPLVGYVDVPRWRRVRRHLDQQQLDPVRNVLFDLVTFGTPVRYGWDTAGYAQLIHFIFHRPAEGLPYYQAPFPPTPTQLLNAADGDYVQQFGIAGTNLIPSPLAWRSWLADVRLHRLLQPNLRNKDLIERLETGARIPSEGTTLLVDYGPDEEEMAGHAVYTRRRWLLPHAEEVARRFYAEAADGIAGHIPPQRK